MWLSEYQFTLIFHTQKSEHIIFLYVTHSNKTSEKGGKKKRAP